MGGDEIDAGPGAAALVIEQVGGGRQPRRQRAEVDAVDVEPAERAAAKAVRQVAVVDQAVDAVQRAQLGVQRRVEGDLVQPVDDLDR